MSQPDQPHILVLPSGALAEEILTPRAWSVLESLGTVERNPLGRMPTSEELAAWLPRATAVMTSWGTPPFDDALYWRPRRSYGSSATPPARSGA